MSIKTRWLRNEAARFVSSFWAFCAATILSTLIS
jgi:hypothetical protein